LRAHSRLRRIFRFVGAEENVSPLLGFCADHDKRFAFDFLAPGKKGHRAGFGGGGVFTYLIAFPLEGLVVILCDPLKTGLSQWFRAIRFALPGLRRSRFVAVGAWNRTPRYRGLSKLLLIRTRRKRICSSASSLPSGTAVGLVRLDSKFPILAGNGKFG
jgi:hypothetical protein